MKIIDLLLRELILDGSLLYRNILMRRPVDAVIDSQRIMLLPDGKTRADPGMFRKVFDSQLLQLDDWLSSQPFIEVLGGYYYRVLPGAPPSTASARSLQTPSSRAVDLLDCRL